MADPSHSDDLTRMLCGIRSLHDREKADRLFAAVYDELRRTAADLMRRERPDHTLRPTALVHDAYIRLCAGGDAEKVRAVLPLHVVLLRVIRVRLDGALDGSHDTEVPYLIVSEVDSQALIIPRVIVGERPLLFRVEVAD